MHVIFKVKTTHSKFKTCVLLQQECGVYFDLSNNEQPHVDSLYSYFVITNTMQLKNVGEEEKSYSLI